MADTSTENSEDGKKKKKNILEEKSKEELVNLVKKYLNLLQKAKNKSDDLTERCSILEKEKNTAVEEHQSTEKELLTKIADLQQSISELNHEKIRFAEKEKEITELRNKLKEAAAENTCMPSLRENEEQLQCLNMQLQSLKASCQCIQEENTKLQALNEELLHENTLLKGEVKSISLNSEKNHEEYNMILCEKNELEAKYNTYMEENRNLMRQIDALKISHESALLKDTNNSILLTKKDEEYNSILNELDKLHERHRVCVEEKENYKTEIKALSGNCEKIKNNDFSVFIKDIEDLRKENKKYVMQIEDLKANSLQENINPDFSQLIKDVEDLRKENETLKMKFGTLKGDDLNDSNCERNIYNMKEQDEGMEPSVIVELQNCRETIKHLEGELIQCQAEKCDLLKDIKSLASLSQISDYKSVIEHALLQGASTEALLLCTEELNNTIVKPPPTTVKVKEIKDVEQPSDVGIYLPEDAAGLEYALLQGGDISSFMVPSDEPVSRLPSHGGSFASQSSIPNDKIIEMENEIKSLRQNLDTYSSLCSDTLEENANLKQEWEVLKSKILIDQAVNTEFEDIKSDDAGVEGNETLENEIVNSVKEKSDLSEKYVHLCKEILSMYERVTLKEDGEIENGISEADPMDLLRALQNIHVDTVVKLEKELNDFNLQLELLVIGIKQGVRQKHSAMSYQAENKLEENMSLLKVILDDLVVRSNNYVSKIRNLESGLISEKKKVEDELAQVKELNQFLEVENRELNIEIKKMKQFLNDSENCNNQGYYEAENYQRSPELYSIDESSELDEKTDDNANVNTDVTLDINTAAADTCDFTIKTAYATNDCAIQVESDLNENTFEAVTDISEKDLNILDDNSLVIDMLRKENKTLTETVQEKSVLVEKIHYQLDFLLAKVEELTLELQEKDDDLKHSKALNTDLKRIQTDVENIKKQQVDALKVAHNSVLELKIKNDNLNDDIKSFGLSSKEFITHVNDNIMNIVKQSYSNMDHYMEKCNHKEQNLSKIKEWINQLIDDFKAYFDFLVCMNSNVANFSSDLCEFGNTLQPPEDFSLFKPCDQDTCCLISKDIELLDSFKFKLFTKFNDHLKNNFISLVKDLDSYKMDIVPSLERNIAELEHKLSEYICKKSPNEDENAPKYVEKEEPVELLKNQLSEAETKMGKFKQIALKLKKELAQIKEQNSDIASEKERLQKHNEKLLEELNKVSGEQYKYVQNYQSLQNEFDKLQDECEVHQVNIKELEEDLAAKLIEFSSSKEEVTELQSQLKSSKQLLDSNLSIKKELEVKYAGLESKVIILESKINDKTQKINSLELDVAKHLKDLNAAWTENKNLKDELELAQKEGKKKSLLDLEMADFEKSISGLKTKIQKRDDQISELQSELKCMVEKYDCLLEEMKTTETLKEIEAKRAESLKDVLEKTKIELNQVKAHEDELLSKTASLEVQLETLTQQKEENKLQLSETASQIQHLQDVVKTSSDNHHRIVKSFEQKISNQKQEILIAHKEVESVKQEFENYKIRVHSVLKQQKTVTPAVTTADADLKEKLENLNEKLKLQVKDLSEKLTAMNLEHEALQEEHDILLQRYNKVIDEQEEKDKEWCQRLDEVNVEKNRLCATQEELSSQHLLQNEMLVATYKKQIKIMSDEHKHIVSDLQKQLDAADIEIARLQRDQQKQQGLPLTPLPHDSSPFDIMSQERQEGEGSESTDEISTPVRNLSLATIPTSGFLPFEKLIQSPLEPGTPASYISGYDSEKLTTNLNTANKKIDHLSELLNESESTNLRLSEQVRVLKDEVRRIENNKEREQHAENLEYLKNVFIKFASLQPGSEKAMLVPVLTTMLKLSPHEQQQLKSVSGDFDSEDASSSGWSGYLHRWSGLS